ncbi:MAG: hypothetical protein ACI30H_07615 [Paludibacteraceae bacterium]
MADISREEWVERSTEENIQLVEKYFETLNGLSKNEYEPGYTRSFIGIRKDEKPCNFAVFTPQKKRVVLGVKLTESDDINNNLASIVGADSFSYTNGWYNINVNNSSNPEKLCAILLEAEKKFVEDTKEVDAKETTENLKKYWVFITADLVRIAPCDEKTVIQNFKEDGHEDFEGGLTEVIQEADYFWDYWEDDDYTDYFTCIYRVRVVPVDSDRPISDYYATRGDGFDYTEYGEGYRDYTEDISPSDISGVFVWHLHEQHIFVYELITNHFDIENLCIYTPDDVEYDGDSLTMIYVDCGGRSSLLYKDGIFLAEL